ncbi:FAD-dependent oxidoreductase [Thalassospira sp.]|uniref:FAD-dependent oxidoreductase n=1 Tax=Thalassospira sp. TaxID=1912094 RepID=UPI002732FF8B|nr:FAD-dependent oxidoreductase [Thalassospira sp.]MDP2699787.1 FAD-dependent oxidoreductase [Thalassospira sp.]
MTTPGPNISGMAPQLSQLRESSSVTFDFGGKSVSAQPGQTVAAALTAAGIYCLSRGVDDTPRGVFCGMGVCNECIVRIDGVSGQRSCMVPVCDGMKVEPQPSRSDLSDDGMADICPVPQKIVETELDVLVVGAGPGGLAAARTVAGYGGRVVVVDDRSAPGGQYFKQPHTRDAKAFFANDRQSSDGAALIADARQKGVVFYERTVVWGGERMADGRLRIGLHGPDGASYVIVRQLVVATGAFERPDPVPGWTLPGVMTTGAAQTLLRNYGVVAGRRVLVAGNGPLNMQVAMELRQQGCDIVALAEIAASPWKQPGVIFDLVMANASLALRGARQLTSLVSAGIPVFWQSRLTRITGTDGVTGAVLTTPQGIKTFEADIVLMGGGFVPSNELLRLLGCAHDVENGVLLVRRDLYGRTSCNDIFAVGEAARFGGAHIALAQGHVTGAEIVRTLGLGEPDRAGDLRQLERHSRFQKVLWSLYRGRSADIRDGEDDTVVCRCENVTLQTLREVSVQARGDVSSLKRLSRAGMGRCQGLYCGSNLQKIATFSHSEKRNGETDGFLAPQMPLRPVPVAVLACEKREWGGHKRTMLPQKAPLRCDEPLPVKQVETLVIGCGIAGLSTALFLAREGHEVVALDRAYPNSLASGGNAGSLHAQLLSFDHGARAQGRGSAAVQTLPLQRDSIVLWGELQKELQIDFEMKVTGGLMVAENDTDLRFLEEKAALERTVGIDTCVIDKNTLYDIEPALAPIFVGAAYCSQEGKINPLLATPAILGAARKAGAQIFDRAEVLAISANPDGGFEVKTSRGDIRVRHIVNASGGFASRIGAMLGLDVPVFGAPLQMVVTEAVEPLISCLVAHADRHLTLKQAANGNFIIGGGWTAGLDPVHQHPRPLFDSLEGNLWIAQHVAPALRKVNVIRSWAAMNIDIDGAPILGEHPDQPGFFNAVTSNGYTLGPMVGHLTASLITGRMNGAGLEPFAISRFSRGQK